MPYVENIKVGSGESWPIRDKEGRELIAEIWSTIYPVGSIYMSVNSTSPELLFGGTWERIQDTFLLAAGGTYAAGATGGEAKVALSVGEMPSHSHSIHENTNGSNVGVLWSNKLDTTTGTTGGVWADLNAGSLLITHTAGGSQPHNNMPPYLAVYIWKRTA